MSRPASVDSLVLAIDEAINILDPVTSHPQLSSFLSVSSDGPQVTTEMRPNFLADDDEDDEDGDDDLIAAVSDLPPADLGPASSGTSGGSSHPTPAGPDGSTAVTRYLIKHLPKQLTQLRYLSMHAFCMHLICILHDFSGTRSTSSRTRSTTWSTWSPSRGPRWRSTRGAPSSRGPGLRSSRTAFTR